ncbi:MAG: VCBS repeat-containing protein [Phycisphaerales bacterium]|nr:VCBS repeat-containing protein [Phycisphaerales bacterium]
MKFSPSAVLWCAAAIAFAGASNASAQFCPADAVPLPNGGAPFSVRSCDLNNDGNADIVTANADTDNVTVRLGDVDATFAAAQLYPAGDEPVDIECCDVDGDGNLDLVTANRFPSQAHVLLNNGVAGGVLQFSAPAAYAVGLAPWGVRCLRLNADARVDLVTSNFTGKSVSVLINNGNGAFAPHVDYATDQNGTYYVDSCDLDGDLDEDVIVSNLTGATITSFRNNGDGTLTIIGSFSTGTFVFPWGVVCCDMDGDNHPDVVTANGGDDTITVLRNNGTGVFGAPVLFTGAGQPFQLTCCDIDGDTDRDILTANLGSDDVTVFANSGNGTLTRVQSLPVGVNVGSVVCADVDHDSDPDVLATAGSDVLLFEADCDDSNPCTIDACVGGACRNTPDDSLCDTGLFCSAQRCDVQLGCVFDNACFSTTGNPCPDPSSCDEQSDTCGGCLEPSVAAVGSRYIRVTPATPDDVPVAILLEGDCSTSAVACVSKYVEPRCAGGANNGQLCLSDTDCPNGSCDKGFLGSSPVFMTAAQWGTVFVHASEIIPKTKYAVFAECDFGGPPVFSAPSNVQTCRPGDSDNDGDADFNDIAGIVSGYKDQYLANHTYQSTNIAASPALGGCGDPQAGCIGQTCINFIDISFDVENYKGNGYPCLVPCP